MLAKFAAAVVLVVAATMLVLPAPAPAYVTPQAAQLAADKAVAWFRTAQSAEGNIAGFGGDWSMIALANAGVNAADVETSVGDPSLQDYYASEWGTTGPGGVSTDQARALLVGHGGGIRGATVSASQNLVARQLRFFSGSQLGLAGTVNDDMFGLLALERNAVDDLEPTLEQEVRRVQNDGGWNYTTNGGKPDIDMTGAGIGTLCAAGAGASDPAVAAALDYIETMQDDASGGFVSDFFGANADSTSWVVNGLRECGIDPQGPRWTTSTGKTPLDFLVELQKANGAFRWLATEPDDTNGNLYATQDSVTALVGEGFGAEPATRDVPGEPTFRPAPAVSDGTVVPMGLVIDHGPAVAGAERACSLNTPVGGDVADVLANTATADPHGCAAEVQTDGGRLVSVNGVAADSARMWVVSVDGGAVSETLGDEVGLGAIVRASLVARPGAPDPLPSTPEEKSLPPVTPISTPEPTRAKATLAEGKQLEVRQRRVGIAVGCPRGLGSAGCRGIVRVYYKAGERRKLAGSAQFTVQSGKRTVVRVRLNKRFRKLVAASDRGRGDDRRRHARRGHAQHDPHARRRAHQALTIPNAEGQA